MSKLHSAAKEAIDAHGKLKIELQKFIIDKLIEIHDDVYELCLPYNEVLEMALEHVVEMVGEDNGKTGARHIVEQIMKDMDENSDIKT